MRKHISVFGTEIYGHQLDNKIAFTLKANNLKFLIHAVPLKVSAESYLKANKRKNIKQTELLYACLSQFYAP